MGFVIPPTGGLYTEAVREETTTQMWPTQGPCALPSSPASPPTDPQKLSQEQVAKTRLGRSGPGGLEQAALESNRMGGQRLSPT